jgi:hypothetical protein
MTELAVDNDVLAVPRKRSRRRWPVAIAVAIVLVVVAAAVTVGTLRHLDRGYGPIQQGSFGGLHSDRGFVFSRHGFSYSLLKAPGVSGELIAAADNLRSHSVEVTSIDTDDIVTSIRWSTYTPPTAGGDVEGATTPWRAFPATIPANGTIKLLITIHHPTDCNRYPPGDPAQYSGLHTVHWKSLLHERTTVIDDGIENLNINVC